MKIYNTLTNKKEYFVPLVKKEVKIYVCGPTVYDYFHIGNARPFIFFDVVRKYFEFCKYKVTFVQNLTDIDDKIIKKANSQNLEITKITSKFIEAFFVDSKQLNIKSADFNPKATDYIPQMIHLIEVLIQKGLAYQAGGDVYFAVEKFVDYGKLSGKKIEEQLAGARVCQNQAKRNPADFTLWKKSKKKEPSWQSPWGQGRPGWHTECVVMSQSILGETFDIHGGGVDLTFPHHENEIAQAEGFTGKKFVNYWMHNGFLNISGQKMSKSLDNFFTARDILKEYDADSIRFFFLSKHYRSPIDFNRQIMQESKTAITNFYDALKKINYLKITQVTHSQEVVTAKNEFCSAMDDDFNTAKAMAKLFDIAKRVKDESLNMTLRESLAKLLVELGQIFGLFSDLEEKLSDNTSNISKNLINLLLNYRENSKKQKDWKTADKIRDDLKNLGIDIKDTTKGAIYTIGN